MLCKNSDNYGGYCYKGLVAAPTKNCLTAKVSKLLQSWEINMKEFIKWCNQRMWVILGYLAIATVLVILYEAFFA